MARRGHTPKRAPLPDPVFQSPLVTRFINNLMLDGKKSTAETIFYSASLVPPIIFVVNPTISLRDVGPCTYKCNSFGQGIDVPVHAVDSFDLT